MATRNLNKDQTIHDLLAKLRERFGKDAFDVVDHWETDLFAVGIARRDNNGVLAYVSTCGIQNGGYYLELELPPGTADDMPYQFAGRQDGIDLERLPN
jgi:hypothetical protein